MENAERRSSRFFPYIIIIHLLLVFGGGYFGYVNRNSDVLLVVVLSLVVLYTIMLGLNVWGSSNSSITVGIMRILVSGLTSIIWFVFVSHWFANEMNSCEWPYIHNINWKLILVGSLFDVIESVLTVKVTAEDLRKDWGYN